MLASFLRGILYKMWRNNPGINSTAGGSINFKICIFWKMKRGIDIMVNSMEEIEGLRPIVGLLPLHKRVFEVAHLKMPAAIMPVPAAP